MVAALVNLEKGGGSGQKINQENQFYQIIKIVVARIPTCGAWWNAFDNYNYAFLNLKPCCKRLFLKNLGKSFLGKICLRWIHLVRV